MRRFPQMSKSSTCLATPASPECSTHASTGNSGGPAGPNNSVPQVPNQVLTRSPAFEMGQAQGAAPRMLEAGITTVRDLGAYEFMDIAMRSHQSWSHRRTADVVSGPPLRSSVALGVAVPEATADGPVEMARVVRRLIACGHQDHGHDCGGPGSQVFQGVYPMFDDEFRVAVEVAHGLDGRSQSIPLDLKGPQRGQPGPTPSSTASTWMTPPWRKW